MKNKFIIYILIIFITCLVLEFFYFKKLDSEKTDVPFDEQNTEQKEIVIEPQDTIKYIEIGEKDTYGVSMEEAGIGGSVAMAIYNSASSTYDLVKIRVGRKIELTYEKETDILKRLLYKVDSEEQLIVQNNKYYENASSSVGWKAFLELIPYEVRIVTKEGEVKSSMYEAALETGIDERAIIELANTFQWTIDFAMDPRVGDKFKFVYEERYLDDEYVMPGSVMAGYYINDGTQYDVYYFEENDDNQGYFDKEGNSVQKMFLKAPVAFRYISSGFTTGARYIKAFNISTGHRAIDYAAPAGTPVRAVGNGTITYVGWNGSYGNTVKVHHNGTYSTNYCHLSRFAVSRGTKVSQGDVIGYVGSTGLSTGPHLHYEMVKNGAKINPLREVLPPGKPIKDENKERFFKEIEKWDEKLNT